MLNGTDGDYLRVKYVYNAMSRIEEIDNLYELDNDLDELLDIMVEEGLVEIEDDQVYKLGDDFI